jgi:hypothetical protein
MAYKKTEMMAVVLGFVFVSSLVIFFIISIAARPIPPNETWRTAMVDRCNSMASRIHFTSPTTVECWRTPFMRMPKLMFTETFTGP